MSIMVIRAGAQLQLRLQLFLRYMEVMRKRGHADWDDAVAGEIYHRLARLEWLEWEVRSRELEARNPTLTNERTAQLMIELPTLTESWYYIAFRTMPL